MRFPFKDFRVQVPLSLSAFVAFCEFLVRSDGVWRSISMKFAVNSKTKQINNEKQMPPSNKDLSHRSAVYHSKDRIGRAARASCDCFDEGRSNERELLPQRYTCGSVKRRNHMWMYPSSDDRVAIV